MSIIIGIDPGSRLTGWGVISTIDQEPRTLGYGVIKLTENASMDRRLALLWRELTTICEKFKPCAMSIEKVFLAKNVDSAFKLGHARGVALAVAGIQQLTVREYATRHVKKMLTGSGAASKEQVRFWVEQLLKIKMNEQYNSTTKLDKTAETTLDTTDALALAICYAREAEVESFMSQSALSGAPGAEKPRSLEK